jgi:TonB-linked SusC/RagA family outer membrane protein
MKKLFYLTLSLLLFVGFAPQIAFGQQRHSISGTVKDASGPVVGAVVTEKGNPSNAVVSTVDGAFAIEIGSPSSVLEVSSLGYQTQEVTVAAGQTSVDVLLESDNVIIDDVVVTALGIRRDRKALGYGVDEVKGDAFVKAKETNVINSMAGRVAGLVVSQTAGGPSGSTRVILRGSTEMTGNNQPLYIIDGVPLDNTNFGSAKTGGGFDLGDGISSINPDDIESMSVLKGPAASALYGSRASHGVILITTKRASDKESFSVEYNGTVTIDTQLAKWDDVQQIYGMGSGGSYSINATSNTQKSWGAKADGSNMLTYFDGVDRPYEIIPNNTSGFFRTGLTATNSAIVSSHSGNTGVRLTFTDMRNRDILPNTNMSRDIFNMRTNTSIKKVDLDFSVNYTHEDVHNRPALGDDRSNIGKNLMTLATTYNQNWLRTYEDVNGEYSNWNGRDPYNMNPYWDVYKNSNESKKDLFRFNGKLVYNITDHFKLQGTAGMELNYFKFEDFKAPTTPGYESGRLQQRDFENKTYNVEVLALYNNEWGDFDLSTTLGGNMYRVDNANTVTTAQDMQIRDAVSLTSFDEVSVVPGSYRKLINSLFGSVNLGWRHMLYLDATVRADQSSTLPVANNVYVYPSFSGSFVFSELWNIKDIIPYAKLRMSWAQVGSDTDPYQLQLAYTKSTFSYPGYTIGLINNGTIPNTNLKPSMTNSFEAGLEMRFLKNRIGLDVTYYTQQSNNQIMYMTSSGTTGYGSRLINAGNIQNKGIEITLNTRPVQTKDFVWDIGINFSKNSNKVLELVDGTDEFVLEQGGWSETPVYVKAKVGENFGSIMGADFLRNEAGQILINSATGLPQYDKSDHVLGNAQWDWTGGLSTNFAYKNIALGALFDVKVGADLFSMSARASYEAGKAMETLEGREGWYRSEEQRQAAGISTGNWTPTDGFIAPGVIDNGDGTYRENDIIIDPEDYWMSVSRAAPGMFIYDNSYIKVRELTLSYTFPEKWFKNKIKSLALSFVARNPFIIWKNIPNIDPDSNYNNTTGMGLEYGSLPSRKSFGFNVNVKF